MGRRILIVDDNMLNRRLATAMLSRNGWETAEATDGLQALKMLEGAHGYHAVLLDISMPNMNGDEVCRLLRADQRTANLPIVAYTAHALEEDRGRMRAAGFDAIATKPVSLATLLECIELAMTARSAA
jgi:two-component system, chemotaxis family, chemotaxis protein CheY